MLKAASFFFLPLRNVSHYKKNSPRCYQKCTYGFMYSTCYSCQILMKLELSRQTFEKYSNTKEWTIPDSRNTPSTTNLEEEETVDALRNDGNASMPEQVKRPNPWKKMMMMMTKFQDNPSRGRRVVPCGRTGGQTDAILRTRLKNWVKSTENTFVTTGRFSR